MKNFSTLFNRLPVLVLLLAFYACSDRKGINDILSRAENIVEQQPDSALRLLDAVLFPEELNKNLFNRYHLLMIRAKDKSDRDITSDTIIFAVKDYYVGKKDIPNAAPAAFYCGRLWQERDSVNRAFEAYAEAEQLAEPSDDYNLKGLIQGNWGILNFKHHLYEQAIELNKKAVEMFDKARNYKNKISALETIGDCFALNNQTDSALYYHNECLKLADSCKIPDLQSDIKESMGVDYQGNGNYEQAKKLFFEALALSRDTVEQARILLNMAQVYVSEDKIDSVKFYLDKVLTLSINDPQLMLTCSLLGYETAKKESRFQDALDYHEKYYYYTMEVFDSEKNNTLLELREKYDFEKLRTSKKESDIKFRTALTGLSLAALVIGILIFLFQRKSVQNRMILSETKQNIESLQRMSDSFSEEKNSFRHVLLEQFDILKKTALLTREIEEKEEVGGQILLKKFNKIVYGQDTLDWNKLCGIIDLKNDNNLCRKIRSRYPQLDETEFHICCLSCETDFGDKEIAIILGKTVYMVQRIRSDLRKKLGIPSGKRFLPFFKENMQ